MRIRIYSPELEPESKPDPAIKNRPVFDRLHSSACNKLFTVACNKVGIFQSVPVRMPRAEDLPGEVGKEKADATSISNFKIFIPVLSPPSLGVGPFIIGFSAGIAQFILFLL